MNVNLTDSADHYINATEYYTVPVYSPSPYTTDSLILLTKDGKGCVGDPNPT